MPTEAVTTPDAWRLPGEARVLLASDMHLGEHDPATAGFFFDALSETLGDHTHLILLGDLFEAWAGDDAADAVAEQAVARIAALARDRAVAVMRGNRDFLLDVPVPGQHVRPFSARAGVRMLTDPTVIVIGELRVLLAHGDAWCTADHDYMAFRAMTRDAAWQQAFLARPLAERLTIARQMREQSLAHQRQPQAAMGDVDPAAVLASMHENDVRWLVHGHTHRPGHHRWSDRGDPLHRLVLPDWDAGASRGGFVRIDANGARQIDAI
ncbi:MAG: UDP-2,3-diacylglucosamine diphosphatase [Burkholderiaceae bacterium]